MIDNIGNNIANLKTQLLIGGTSTEIDIKNLKDNCPQILVGCPGRIHDIMRRKHINGDMIKLDDGLVELVNKLTSFYDKFKARWAKVLSQRKKTKNIDG